jgi:hypothetical protein
MKNAVIPKKSFPKDDIFLSKTNHALINILLIVMQKYCSYIVMIVNYASNA